IGGKACGAKACLRLSAVVCGGFSCGYAEKFGVLCFGQRSRKFFNNACACFPRVAHKFSTRPLDDGQVSKRVTGPKSFGAMRRIDGRKRQRSLPTEGRLWRIRNELAARSAFVVRYERQNVLLES